MEARTVRKPPGRQTGSKGRCPAGQGISRLLRVLLQFNVTTRAVDARTSFFFTLLRALPSGERALSAVHALRRSIESCLSSPSTKVSQGSNGNDDRQALQSDRQLTVSQLAGLLAFSDTHPSSSLMRLLLFDSPKSEARWEPLTHVPSGRGTADPTLQRR